jgi:hypothetical protein
LAQGRERGVAERTEVRGERHFNSKGSKGSKGKMLKEKSEEGGVSIHAIL